MVDLTEELYPFLKRSVFSQHLPDEDYIFPAYQDQSILNIPSTICQWFGIPRFHSNPLKPTIAESVGENFKNVIVILLDALSFHRLVDWMQKGDIPVWQNLLDSGTLAPITSIVPSTTTSAITSLWTGASTVEHGVAGYEVWLKEYGVVTNMIQQAPMTFKGSRGSLEKAGFKPEHALTVPTFGPHLRQHGVSAHAFQHYSISHSGLSQTFFKDVTLHPFASASELWVDLRELLESRQEEKLYSWVYWGNYDGLAHRYGPDDERAMLEFINFSQLFQTNFIQRLSRSLRGNTLIVLTADHGQLLTPKNPLFDLGNHPEFLDSLHIKPTGENRLSYLHIRPGRENFIKDYVESNWSGMFSLLDTQTVLQLGLFGPGKPTPEIASRFGDMMLLSNSNHYLWWSNDENPLLGRHGGLSPEEMVVPFLASRL